MIDEQRIQSLMKRCQRGTGTGTIGHHIANDLHADCYGALGALLNEVQAIRRGEFICSQCGLRKDSEFQTGDF